jgi:hypothetical protein
LLVPSPIRLIACLVVIAGSWGLFERQHAPRSGASTGMISDYRCMRASIAARPRGTAAASRAPVVEAAFGDDAQRRGRRWRAPDTSAAARRRHVVRRGPSCHSSCVLLRVVGLPAIALGTLGRRRVRRRPASMAELGLADPVFFVRFCVVAVAATPT